MAEKDETPNVRFATVTENSITVGFVICGSEVQKVYSVNQAITAFIRAGDTDTSQMRRLDREINLLPQESDKPMPAALAGPGAAILGADLLACATAGYSYWRKREGAIKLV